MPPRVVVVSRNRSLVLGLSSCDFEVVDIRADELEDVLADGGDVDALVVGTDDPVAALDLVERAHGHDQGLPVLLVSGDDPGWASVQALDDRTISVLSLPITGPMLANAVATMVRPAPPAVPEIPTQAHEPALETLSRDEEPAAAEHLSVEQAAAHPAEQPPPNRPADVTDMVEPAFPEPPSAAEPEPVEPPSAGSTIDLAPPIPEGPTAAGAHPHPTNMSGARRSDSLRERLAGKKLPSGLPAPEDFAASTEPTQRSTRRGDDGPRLLDVDRIAEAPPPEPRAEIDDAGDLPSTAHEQIAALRRPSTNQIASTGEVRQLVHALLACADQLHDLRDAAAAVIEEAVVAAAADAGVLLLPNGDDWRVSGGVALRPLEWRYALTADSWLVETVITSGRGVIVEDSDIARQRLGGAPLAHRRHLLTVPIPAAGGLMLLARDLTPFQEDTLAALAKLGDESGPVLTDAMNVRALARALAPFSDLD